MAVLAVIKRTKKERTDRDGILLFINIIIKKTAVGDCCGCYVQILQNNVSRLNST